MAAVTTDELRKVIALNELPDEHLQWIIDHSEYHEYEDGTLILKFGDPAETMWFMLEGVVNFYLDVNGRQVHYYTFENDTTTGGVGGLLPYSRMKIIPGYTYAVGSVKTLSMHKDYFPALEQLNPDLIQRLIGYMTERARSFATTQLQHEKVNALGNLAAGIAHELNNPAAAINRISSELTKRLNLNFELTEKLIQCGINSDQIQHLRVLVEKKEIGADQKIKLTTLQRMKMEEEIADWLEDQGIGNKIEAETFSEYGFTIPELESISNDVGKDRFSVLLPWLENILSSRKIIMDLDDASGRISDIVSAIKSHVQMDRTNALQPTNIHKDIENTLTLLGFKFRDKSINLKRTYCAELPIVSAYIGELNQVWTNLIDNAIFAVPKNGNIEIETTCDSKNIIVKIIDNGGGIPKEIQTRIFEPFFTTKKVGEGTGIGLDIVSRIVKKHNGDIKINSVPGRTEFAICIPILQKQTSN